MSIFDVAGRRYAARVLVEARAERHELRQQWAATLDALELARANLLEARKAAMEAPEPVLPNCHGEEAEGQIPRPRKRPGRGFKRG
ncbi:hypothetical protein ACNHE5_19875 [Pandoraea pnomenusa]|uniref:hypothetical protein n=1 Tax=Pandoraea pnomenusa TaxID=93220 RepID=UPI003CF348C4